MRDIVEHTAKVRIWTRPDGGYNVSIRAGGCAGGVCANPSVNIGDAVRLADIRFRESVAMIVGTVEDDTPQNSPE